MNLIKVYYACNNSFKEIEYNSVFLCNKYEYLYIYDESKMCSINQNFEYCKIIHNNRFEEYQGNIYCYLDNKSNEFYLFITR